MGFSKTEVNLRRLLAAAPQQQNQAKLIHYVATLREQLEQLGAETTPEGLPRISKAKANEYSEKIEALAAKLAAQPGVLCSHCKSKARKCMTCIRTPKKAEERIHEIVESDPSKPIKLDAAAQAHIEKHRKLQEDLTDEMVGLAQQLKASSLMMNQSVRDTEKILDSTERAVEHSLASTGHANTRAMEIYSESFKTTCFTWLIIFIMTCVFVMVVLLIRVT